MNESSIPIIIQATNRSPMMEAKALSQIKDGVTVIEYLVRRLQQHWSGEVVLATSTESIDDSLHTVADRLGIKLFRGDQDNLISRLYNVAKLLNCRHFVRVFGSYPFVDIQSMKEVVSKHFEHNSDYSYNGHRKGVPWGMECEVLSVEALERLLSLDLNREQLETATYYIRQNPTQFKQTKIESHITRPNYKLALETEKDLVLIQDIAKHIPEISLDAIVEYLDDHPIIAISNHETPPKEVGLEKVFIYPDKINSLMNNMLDGSYPISVELSLTNRCNLKCVYCSDGDLRKRQGVRESLDKQTLFKLFDDLKLGGTRGVVLEGGGEPTIHPDFDIIVRYLSNIGLAIGLITNGTKPLSQDILRKFEWIRVSLDASTPDEYRSLKGVDCFEEVLSNVYYYAQHCPTVGIGYVVTDSNISEVEALVIRLKEYGSSYVQFRPVVDCPELFPVDRDLGYLACYQSSSFAVITDGMRENADRGNSGLPCKAHSLTSIISADGSVYICGRLNIYKWVKPLGNISEQSFKEIWLGSEREKQNSQVIDVQFCRENCPQCRITKFNELLARMHSVKTPNFI